jgi:ribonuclease D
LNPFKGKIRLVSIIDAEGLKTFDLKKASLSRELLETIRTSELIIQNADFELRWFGRHFGFIPKSVFCTKTADQLLIPGETIGHRLEDIVERRLGVIINKEMITKPGAMTS